MRIVMLGTGPFAVPTLRALVAAGHDVAAVLTRPTAPAAGRRSAAANPMRDAALEAGLPCHDPPDVNSSEARVLLAGYEPALLVVCDYGQILKDATLAVARHGGINLHGSLLPKYRGAAPVAWAIYHGETETGDSVIHMTPGLDAGPILGQCRAPIDPDETAGELEARLAALGGPLVIEVVSAIEAGQTSPVAQDPRLATKAPRLKKEQGHLDWTRPAEQLRNQIRAFQPWPRSYCQWSRAGQEPLRLMIDRVTSVAGNDAPPGGIVSVAGELIVGTGAGLLRIEKIQPAGKRVLSAAEFLRGYPLQVGEALE